MRFGVRIVLAALLAGTMRRIALAAFLALTLSACGSRQYTTIDPATGVCYQHDRDWVIWQINNNVYPTTIGHCRP